MHRLTNIDSRLLKRKVEDLIKVPVIITVNHFTENSVKVFIEDMRAAREAEQEIIPIVINSYGGNIYALLAMMDYIETCDRPVATIIEGKAMSAGAALFSSGDEGLRFIAPNATVMIHEAAHLSFGKVNDVEVGVKEIRRLNNLVTKKMAKNCGHSADYFSDIIHEKNHANWYLTAKQAKEHNLANHIGIPVLKVDISVSMELANK
jgi:ATP-dependent Clp endopeptidase proteolytic subunit ClpP